MKRREDSFFGLHFDFHANPEYNHATIGQGLKEEDIREICTRLRPDYLQIDCKGHPGYASYPSECGNAMPRFEGDPLSLWRRVTKEEDVALYMHYSGVWDWKYASEHPTQAVLTADGTRHSRSVRTNGNYLKDVMIPQLYELAGKYGVDGVWVDGDCWGANSDFDPETVAQFEKETGIHPEKLPTEPGDPYYEEYRDFCRELYRRYVRAYVDAVHDKFPKFQIASNWAFTDHMPEPVCADVDFLSGDLNPWDSFESARFSGRAIASQGMAWDLMSWNHRNSLGGEYAYAIKHPIQLQQEAAAVIALGGGFQNYITQNYNGTPKMNQIRRMKALADFMRARQPYCHHGKALHQAVLLLSTEDRHKESESLFSRNGNEKIVGMCSLLCDVGTSLEVAEEHTLLRENYDYPLICIPEVAFGLRDETVNDLLEYTKRGGSLLLIGENTAKLFSAAGAPFRTEHADIHYATLDGGDYAYTYESCVLAFEEGETVARAASGPEGEGVPFAAVLPYGHGKIGVVAANIGLFYQKKAQYFHRHLIRALLDRLYEPKVRVAECEGTLELVDLVKDGKLFCQLVNANGNHRAGSVITEDTIPSCRDITLEIRLDTKPRALIQRPCGKELPFTYQNGIARVTLDKVSLHEIVEVVE